MVKLKNITELSQVALKAAFMLGAELRSPGLEGKEAESWVCKAHRASWSRCFRAICEQAGVTGPREQAELFTHRALECARAIGQCSQPSLRGSHEVPRKDMPSWLLIHSSAPNPLWPAEPHPQAAS